MQQKGGGVGRSEGEREKKKEQDAEHGWKGLWHGS